ncbi:MAG: hypothetical protein L0Y60_03555 [Beijerinckiaceae bacterium]|nr:hypothetical protein [Beijerinckiaceae bacterium]
MDKLDKAADEFHQALQSGEVLETEIKRNAAFHAGLLIEGHLKGALRSVDDFTKETFVFLAAAAAAGHELNAGEGNGFVEGDSWNRLVRGLAEWFESKGLRVTAAKGGKPSPFVVFVHELQLTFPERLRRHYQSDEALAQAINAARWAGP